MKLPRIASLILAVVAFTAPAYGAQSGFQPNLQQGNIRVGGSISFQGESPQVGNSTQSFDVSLPLQYFVIDRLAIGGAFEYNYSNSGGNGTSFYDGGPALTFYFWTDGRLASYLEPEFYFEYAPSSNVSFAVAGELALQYFITPSVAIGPSVRFFHRFARGSILSTNVYSFAGGFTIHL